MNQDLMSEFREIIPEFIPHQKYHKVSFNFKELDFLE